jgi:hypothetical protein
MAVVYSFLGLCVDLVQKDEAMFDSLSFRYIKFFFFLISSLSGFLTPHASGKKNTLRVMNSPKDFSSPERVGLRDKIGLVTLF